MERKPVPRLAVEASIRSIADTNAIATRPALPPLPARVLPNALLLVPFSHLAFYRVSTLTEHTPLSLEVFMLQEFHLLLKVFRSTEKVLKIGSAVDSLMVERWGRPGLAELFSPESPRTPT